MRTDEIIHSPYQSEENKFLVLTQVSIKTSNAINRVSQNPPQYNFYVGNNTKRILSSHSLPKFIQLKLAMINSIPKDDWNTRQYEDYLLEVDCYAHRKHLNKHPEFKHIGWQVSDSIYVIVLDEDELTKLKGTTVDTRKESQIKSQANS
tara:strand:- start:294 stop:740 length:447 start_codon:yes stop_codon:yes gene_type:complete